MITASQLDVASWFNNWPLDLSHPTPSHKQTSNLIPTLTNLVPLLYSRL